VKTQPLLLGITGAFGSGKTTASHYFVEQGLTKISLSSFLEAELKKRSSEQITRKALQDLGNEWRSMYGAGILAEKALEQIKERALTHVVIDGIRNLSEIEALRSDPTFLLLAVVSDRKTRFERLKKSPRREELSWDSFTALDYRDLGVGEKDTGLQTGMCISLADAFIDNNDSLEILEGKLEKFLK
jgi:dephospho-CoA kinase